MAPAFLLRLTGLDLFGDLKAFGVARLDLSAYAAIM
jgi:hypothetical protein